MSRNFPAQDDIVLTYSTPILARVVAEHEAVNENLSALILAREISTTGLDKSNIGGWHSGEDFLTWGGEDVKSVQQWFAQAIRGINDFAIGPERSSGELDATAWANISRAGDYHQPHFHPGNDWSGVYYVATGNDGSESSRSGCIDMLDPRSGVGMMHTPGLPYTGTVQFKPQPGMILVFPSWLVHYVHPHEGSSERISIALNARMINDQQASTDNKKEQNGKKRFWSSKRNGK